jgi:tripartite ATP-independent transporter DctP family solute receptor
LKRILSLSVALALTVSLIAGCSGGNKSNGQTVAPAPGTTAASTDKLVLKFSTTDEDNGVDHLITQKFKQRLVELSGGKMDVNLFMAGQMGDEKQTLELMKMGELDVGYNAIQGDLYYKDLSAISIPFVFPDVDAMDRFMAGPVGDKIKQALLEKGGVRYEGMFDFGARYFTSNKPFKSPAEMKGIKIRLPQIQSWIDIFKQIGAAPTPIAATEIVTALKTGTVDGQENFLTNIAGRQMWEYQKYLIATKHVSLPQTWLVSEQTFQKLSADQKQWLEQAIKEAIAFERPQVEQLNAGFIKQCTDKGMTLIEPDRDAFVKAAQPAIDKTLKAMAPGVQEAAQAAIKGK